MAWVVAVPATNFQAVRVVFAVEDVTTLASRSTAIWNPLIGPKLIVPVVTPAELQVPPVRFDFPTWSV